MRATERLSLPNPTPVHTDLGVGFRPHVNRGSGSPLPGAMSGCRGRASAPCLGMSSEGGDAACFAECLPSERRHKRAALRDCSPTTCCSGSRKGWNHGGAGKKSCWRDHAL
ncbi:hypothetical protein NDU88_004498 [Pleurodeles waltl]|uniref:Uncharacterized protein n=1 Tax=Pleurodeles waltl TaxID=8319 RepID=A0AAV7WXZ0_PLEWA|nr:hypothetical protein NDU88_004498 [Pleurodeles waltl]